MRKHVETFRANKGYKLVIVVEICDTLFKSYLNGNEASHNPTFYVKMNHFNIVFHKTWDKW